MGAQLISNFSCASYQSEEDTDIRKGPWTVEEDSILAEYIAIHGEGRWNTAALCAGLKRTGKSCRLRWLNYLRPDVRRGNISLQEQLLILELHSRWGNRWSKIAQYLPGRTDNEIKNYWRTRVQKLAKQLKCDVNSKQFRDTMRHVWMPRLIERIQASSRPPTGQPITNSTITQSNFSNQEAIDHINETGSESVDPNIIPEISGSTSSDSWDTQISAISDPTDSQNPPNNYYSDSMQNGSGLYQESDVGSWGWYNYKQGEDMQAKEQQSSGLLGGGDSLENLWNEENIWFLQQQLM